MFLHTRVSLVFIAFLCVGSLLQLDNAYTATAAKPVIHKAVSRPVHPVSKVATKQAAPKAVNSKASVAAIPNPNAFIAYYNLGKAAYLGSHYLEAEKLLKQAYTLAEPWAIKNPNGFQQKNLAIVSQLIGNNAYQLKNYDEAQLYLNRTLTIYNLPAYAASHEAAIMSANLVLGQMAMYDSRFQEANNYYKTALPLQEKLLGSDHSQTQQTRLILDDIAHIDYGPDYLSAIGQKVTHWTHPEEPINIYIADGSSMPGWNPQNRTLVLQAYTEWQRAMEDLVHFRLVTDPEQADTIVSWMERPEAIEKSSELTGKQELRHGKCQTQMLENKWMKDDIVIALNNTDGKAFSANAIRNTMLHEIAHSLGLIGGHSANPSDVLFPNNRYEDGRQKHLTERDINTARKLYSYPAEVTNPAYIHLMRYQQYANFRIAGGNAYNQKDFPTAVNALKAALSIYNQEPETHFLLGVSAYQLKDYAQAFQPLMNAVSLPNRYQDEALKLAGYSLIKLGEMDEHSGAKYLGEQKYQQAYNILSQGMQSIAIKPENQKQIREEMSWLSQRLSRSPFATIQWEPVSQASTGEQESGKKKRGWFSNFAASFTPYIVPTATSN